MMLFTTFLGIPFVWMKAKQQVMNQWIVKTVSLISIAYGVYYMYHIAAEI